MKWFPFVGSACQQHKDEVITGKWVFGGDVGLKQGTKLLFKGGNHYLMEYADNYIGFYNSSGIQMIFHNNSIYRGTSTGTKIIFQGSSSTTPSYTWRDYTNTGLGLSTTTHHPCLIDGGTEALEVDSDSTAGNTRLLVYDVDTGSLQRVSVGANDSGGSGYRLLRIPNT